MKIYKIKGKVWRWPGVGGWHFVYVDKNLTDKIKKEGAPYKYGSGFIGITAKVGKSEWQTALFPHTKENVYLISLKQKIRTKEEIFEGDTVSISFTFRNLI